MLYNPYVVVPLATWAVAQVAKFAIAAIKGKIDFRFLYASGGMPSVHSAVVMSLATTAYLVDGPGSHLFGFAVIFAVVVMYDSFGVRRSTGEQGAILNLLLDNLERNRFKLDMPVPPRLREILGHQPREVAAGAILGVVLAGLFNYDRVGPLTAFLTATPARLELWIYAAIFLLMVVAGVVVRIVLGRRYRKSQVMKPFRARLFTMTQTVGITGLVLSLFAYERAAYLAWRLWPVLMLVIAVIWGLSLAMTAAKVVPGGLAAEADRSRKLKWFRRGRKSR